jgi:radical SAM family uncharacterized protein
MKEFSTEDILKNIQKPGSYAGGEWNAAKKDPQRVETKIALVFPDLYEIGMSYLGQKILYSLLNSHSLVLAERVYAPWVDLEKELKDKNAPLCSIENRIPLFQFDIIGFSLLYELNYSNILTILSLGRIPLRSSERTLDFPLVIAGGPAAFNPESLVDVFDLFLIGDGEEAFLEIVERHTALKKQREAKESLMKELGGIEGVYIPSHFITFQPKNSPLLAVKPKGNLPSKIKKRVYSSFHRAPALENPVVPNTKSVFDRVSIEVERGCPQKCRFCQAASIYFPPRAKDPSLVVSAVLNSLRSTGYGEASLAALSVSDYPYLNDVVAVLVEELQDQKISLSLSSLRPKGLTDDVVKNILRVRKTGFTLVPEAGTERLRNVINKDIKDSEIYGAAQSAFSHGWKLLKLYFMVGLPTEKDEDIQGIVEVVQEIIRMGYKILKKAPQINLSVSSFIPKPHTPFQWFGMESEQVLREKHIFLLSSLKKYPFVRFKRHFLKSSILEGIFSRGDRNLNSVLFKAWENGARFDSWSDHFNFKIWQEAFETQGIDFGPYLSSLDREAVLPWDHIDTGIKKSHLAEELERALAGMSTPSCLERTCSECSGCDLSSLYEKKYEEEVPCIRMDVTYIGKKTEEIYRYEAVYSKRGESRFLSHSDINNIIQNSFRRASIPVVYSGGFHPKMMISYPPALPLGMEGKAERFEFRSDYLFSEEEFLSGINAFLPSGIHFIHLKKLDSLAPPLNKRIKTLVYSVDLKSNEIKDAISKIRQKKKGPGGDEDLVQE